MIRPGTLFAKLFLGTTLLIVIVLGTCTWLIADRVDQFYADELTEYLKGQAVLIRERTQNKFDAAHIEELRAVASELGSATDHRIRITLILRNGDVLADSEADPEEMEAHHTRPEVVQAFARGWGENTRHSDTVDREMKYVAVAVGPVDDPIGVVRVAMGLRTILQRASTIEKLIWIIMLLGFLAAVVFALGLAHLWSNPIRRITSIARSLSHGDLSARADVSGDDEIALLAQSLNHMRDNLAAQVETIDRQRRTLESLLTQLHEGVIVVGPDERILLVNPAAVRLLRLADSEGLAAKAAALTGLPVDQCVPQRELRDVLRRPRDGDVEEVRLTVQGENGEVALMARASDIMLPGFEDHAGADTADQRRTFGRMLALTDVTELDHLVRVKTDFASNASHELRTPLSAIRAAVDTLLNINPADDSASARHFLSMIDRHSNRMEQMVSDLLDLSRIESSPARFKPQAVDLRQLLEDLHTRHRDRLDAKQLQWTSEVPADLHMAHASTYLLRIVLDNLVDNAIKFTEPGGRISVHCERTEEGEDGRPVVSIAVRDTGCGIGDTEQDRVFERFYQVEKARSGADRGTGLGLSIVRHAVAAMNGHVDLWSRVGEGTLVTITFPQND